MTLKRVFWVGSSRRTARELPAETRLQLGRDLYQVQLGRSPSSWRPMSSIGLGVIELRVSVAGEFRLLYVARFAEGIYVLHVFHKKRRKTSPLDLDVARVRFRMACRMHAEM
ncbi:MAG: type II toxin-antitoxin system RelE/ParE family toxin [Gemmatimonadota bacterium]|nr:type II toxin-antitoxin system RelE/ParE family toxin [Gemmatimonadota bacterium]